MGIELCLCRVHAYALLRAASAAACAA
jgi:hypothetical protein